MIKEHFKEHFKTFCLIRHVHFVAHKLLVEATIDDGIVYKTVAHGMQGMGGGTNGWGLRGTVGRAMGTGLMSETERMMLW